MESKVVLITGGSGGFGKALTKEILKLNPKVIRIFSNDEAQIVDMQDEMRDDRLRFLVGDIRDKDRVKKAMRDVDIVVHSAALKHVPIAEYNPDEAVSINITGSINVGECAIDCEVDKVLGISSDKAVHPINIYGATKLVMEKYFMSLNENYKTKFACIRYGNFWGAQSRGSVIDKWMKQRARGESITMTDKEMSRFFITFDEAVAFAINVLNRMEGGEIFIPIMPTHTLEELASNMAPECKIQIIGKRKSEKKTEQLIAEGEESRLTREDDCLIIRET
ncbi:hypothetical protein LCGC14_0773120 [marine sediment metagenome]|uniref:Polysaccharide biosynthesis protein CapD-like domain-containing protein n=1 Tax=marine sediment metagenome TaxID=412755 RepID=A0A0F9Q1V0_9ZZZZ